MALVVLGLAGACTDGGESGPTPEPTPTVASPSPSASEPEVVKPERPEAMDRDDAEGAAAAAIYFLSLRSYMMVSGDTAEWEAMSHESCGFCSGDLEQARQIHERGDSFSGGRILATVVEVYARDSLTGVTPLDVEMDESVTSIVDHSGQEIFRSDRSVEVNRVEMGQIDGEWVVVEVASLLAGG
ncbi:DUF6318 family protein [Antribacter sp. KLBMP9083]|uniref:DUF6318 family protein n=1 Tax=Antribacter soli TaxID=2910976 RepID=A0AA41QC41_9MICO|nr:DUF6318 family protein [Antribacter soli]MCF4120401.1 DUF6318 family protein [Antribacter soli]